MIIQLYSNAKDKLRNLITFTIRATVLKDRYKEFGNPEIAVVVLKNKINYKLRAIFQDYWYYYNNLGNVQAYKDKYLIEDIFGSIVNGDLYLSF